MNKDLINKENKGFLKNALSLALPIAFQNLLTSCATLIDTAMVIGLGDAATSAMGVASRFSFLLNTICFGFASGCAALLSQYWGVKDKDNIKRSLGLALTASMVFGILYTFALAIFPEQLAHIFTDELEVIPLAASYLRYFSIGVPFIVFSQIMCIALRSVECVKIPLISSGISVVVNTTINYLLIGGHCGFPALGLRGAALGSVIGYVVQSLFIIICVLTCETPFKGKLREFFSFSKKFSAKYFKTALPVLFNESFWAVGSNVYSMVFARQGVENHAGYTLYENVQQIFFVFFVGICGACSVMVGMRVGAGDYDDAYKTAKRFAVLTPAMGVVLGFFLILLRDPLLSLFPIETAGARSVASDCLFFYGLWIAIRMIPYTMICGIFRPGGDTKTGCLLDLVGLYLLGIPSVLITGLLIRPQRFVVLVAVMFIAEDVAKGILCFVHFRSKKWIKQITDK